MMLVRRLGCRASTVAAGVVFVFHLWAAPPLTTIQDVLYRADGTRFNGLAVITWNSFEAADTSNITKQSITVRIIDGNLRVKLVPNSNAVPPAAYSVKYNSDGRIQFEETWVVPPSSLTLRVRDVRVSAAPTLQPGQTSLQETDIIGLTADLAARPLKAPAYSPGRAAFINSSGALEAVVGNLSDCVRVDGSSGPCDPQASAFVDAETPAGIVDGANTTFTIAAVPNPASSLAVYRNGLLQKAGQDYTATSNTLQFLAASVPQPGDTLLASYRLAGLALSAPQVLVTPDVLCAGTGTSTNSTTPTSLATCSIAAGTLHAGDRVEIRFDYSHEGGLTGFHAEVRWGNLVLVQRDAGAGDALVTGRADSALHATGAQLSAQSWGTVLPFSTAVGASTDSPALSITISFVGSMAQATTETVTLRNFTVVRYP